MNKHDDFEVYIIYIRSSKVKACKVDSLSPNDPDIYVIDVYTYNISWIIVLVLL